jgi:hypothetical protein
MQSSVLPFTSSEACETATKIRISMASLALELDNLSNLRGQYTLADHDQRDAKRDAILVLIREKLKDIRTQMMNAQTDYHSLMSKCNEL